MGRLDLRHGPALDRIRRRRSLRNVKKDGCDGNADEGGNSIVLSSAFDNNEYNSSGGGVFLRGHESLLEIIFRTMNPRDDTGKRLWLGNIGRWNFGGTGNNGSYQNLRLSPVGGIVSLPGSADQALHADTP